MSETTTKPTNTPPIRIKICGITSLQDALRAVEAGADYLGLIFVAKSPRAIDVAKAKEIAACLQGETQLVGVFQNPSLDEVQTVLRDVPLNFIQLHGEESSEFLAQMPLPVIRFLPLTTPETLLQSLAMQLDDSGNTVVTALLAEPPKGSGQSTLAWMQANPGSAEILQQLCAKAPLFLAGGLTPDNIGAVLEQCRPFAVDVASGVEASPGVKDPDKLTQFCQTVKRFTDIPGDQSLCNLSDFSALMAAFMSPNP